MASISVDTVCSATQPARSSIRWGKRGAESSTARISRISRCSAGAEGASAITNPGAVRGPSGTSTRDPIRTALWSGSGIR